MIHYVLYAGSVVCCAVLGWHIKDVIDWMRGR